jgi:hypothetical protein
MATKDTSSKAKADNTQEEEEKNTGNAGQGNHEGGTQTTHLNSAAELIAAHVESKSLSGVSNAISSWIKVLSEYKELKEIAASLEDLKDAISAKDTEQIVSLMAELGEATVKAAEGAEGDESKGIKTLGKALTAGSKALGKLAK